MIASDAQLERLFDLMAKLAKMCGATLTEVTLALLGSKTLSRAGYTGCGYLTERQAVVAEALLESWIEKAQREEGKR